jgi:uncharacterized membrane protein YecN with MAPEG domain
MINLVPVTALYASFCALLLLGLSYRVVRFRQTLKVSLGSEDKPELERAIRVQANFVEYVPTILMLMLLAELNHLAPWILHIAGAGIFIARVMHAWGLASKRGTSPGRFYGTLFTWVILLCLALANLVLILF